MGVVGVEGVRVGGLAEVCCERGGVNCLKIVHTFVGWLLKNHR